MKKFVSILLVLMLCLGVALAETEETVEANVNNDFTVTFTEPEGYTAELERVEDLLIIFLASDTDPDACAYVVGIAHSELLDGVEDFGAVTDEMSDEEKEALKALVAEDFANPTFSMTETAYGTKLLLVNENDGESDYAVLITYYKSYLVEMDMLKQGEITEAEIQVAIDVLSSMEFVEE